MGQADPHDGRHGGSDHVVAARRRCRQRAGHRVFRAQRAAARRAPTRFPVLRRCATPAVANGSLWTIPQEVRCDLALALIGATGLLASRRSLGSAFVAAIIVPLIAPVDTTPALERPRTFGLALPFGAPMYLWRDRLFVSWPLALAAVVTLLLFPASTASGLASVFSAAYLTLVVAAAVPATVKQWRQRCPTTATYLQYGFVAQLPVVASTKASHTMQ